MRTLKLTIAYDGTAYAGWQCQPDKPTVQETLENAVAKVTGSHSRILASGRTDAGVHALGQVVCLRTDSKLPPDVLLRAVNANLPRDIAVLDAAEAPEGFHPIRDAVRKRYRYTIHDGPIRDVFGRHFVWHYVYGRLDAEAMQRAAAALLGTHDFRSFESSGAERKTSVRTIYDLSVERGRATHLPSPFRRGAGGEGSAEDFPSPFGRGAGGEGRAGDCPDFHSTKMGLSPSKADAACAAGQGGNAGDFITIEVEADGFLYNMVRSIVGTLVEVGRGAQSESWPGEVLHAMDRRVGGPTAPPQGLCLVRVEYEEGRGAGE